MTLKLKVEHLHKKYGSMTVLDDMSFSLEEGVRVGLVGSNGTGKSTLLKILAGEMNADSGTVTRQDGLVIGYMPQDTSVGGDESVFEYIRRVSGFKRLEEEMSVSEVALAEYERRHGYAFSSRMSAMLDGFGLGSIAEKPLNRLSSGQKGKVFMTGVLLSDPDMLLLDEPTNNLDLSALLWLEQFLASTDMACIIVSHDRLFLDRLVRKIFEIDWHTRTLLVSNGTYSDYLERKRKEMARQQEAYGAQQEEIGRLTDTANKKRQKAQKGARFMGTDNDKFLRGFKRDRAGASGKAAKAIEKRIEQMDRVERPITRDALQIRLEAEKPNGSRDIVLRDLAVGYPKSDICVQVGTLTVEYGQRVAILGPNGSGKSTLLRSIRGELSPLSGTAEVGNALVIGNFTQEHQNLPREGTLLSFLSQRAGLTKERVYAFAKQYGFLETQVESSIGDLSPGGRARLLFAFFSALSANVLLLDEPTNHLDIEALDALEKMLETYTGTVIVVSHDRHFLHVVNPTDTYLIEGGEAKRIDNLDAYIARATQHAAQLLRKIS